MAEGFEPYHVPQQSRRDKLRLPNLQLQGLLPIFYDPPLISPDFLTCADTLHHQQSHTVANCEAAFTAVKEEGGNFMGYFGGNFSGSTSSIHLNPGIIHDVEGNPFLYNPQSLKFLDHGGQAVCASAALSACGQGLSLSLCSQDAHQRAVPLALDLQNYEHDSAVYCGKAGSFVPGVTCGEVFTTNELSRSSTPFGPFTGYASILKESRFFRPSQQLLEEICDVGEGICVEKMATDTVLLDPWMENVAKTALHDDPQSCNLGTDQRRKKSRLMSMLDEVCKRYKQYCHQIQAVVASFESIAGIKNAAPFAMMALKAMSKHFGCLGNAISDQLRFLTEPHGHVSPEKDIDSPGFDSSGTGIIGFVRHQPVWRPQRGLPERAVTILRAWLFDHFLHPYPTDADKLMLAKRTGLSRNQVSNWFINARVRLWKPMVEEIHMLETRQGQKSSQEEAVNVAMEDDHLMSAANKIPVSSQKTSTSVQRIEDISLKRTRNELTTRTENAISRNYGDLSSLPHLGYGAASGGASGGVSLTLGLQQSHGGTGLPEPFPLTSARRFGLVDRNGEGYVAGGWH